MSDSDNIIVDPSASSSSPTGATANVPASSPPPAAGREVAMVHEPGLPVVALNAYLGIFGHVDATMVDTYFNGEARAVTYYEFPTVEAAQAAVNQNLMDYNGGVITFAFVDPVLKDAVVKRARKTFAYRIGSPLEFDGSGGRGGKGGRGGRGGGGGGGKRGRGGGSSSGQRPSPYTRA